MIEKLTVWLACSMASVAFAAGIYFAATDNGTAAIWSLIAFAFWCLVAWIETDHLAELENEREWKEAKKHPRI